VRAAPILGTRTGVSTTVLIYKPLSHLAYEWLDGPLSPGNSLHPATEDALAIFITMVVLTQSPNANAGETAKDRVVERTTAPSNASQGFLSTRPSKL
jgi:hypothetical protein